MLGCLAASAAMAVVALLTPWGVESYRLVGTTVAASITCALMLGAARVLDSDKNRQTFLFTMGLLLAEFVLVLLALWDPLGMIFGHRREEEFAFTALAFGGVGVPAAVLMHVRQRSAGRWAGGAGLVLCAASLAFFLAAIWSTASHRWNASYQLIDNLLGTGWLLLLLALVGAVSLGGVGVDRWHWRWIGVGAAAAAFALAMRDVWGKPIQGADRPLILTATAAFLCAHANMLWLCDLTPGQRWLRWCTIAFAFAAGAMYDYATLTDRYGQWDNLQRQISAAGVCAACGTVAIALLAAFNRRAAPLSAAIEFTQIVIVCPMCHKKQTAPAGESVCTCGMRFSIQLLVPRCAQCGYTLLMLQSDRCPECGMPIQAPTVGVSPAV
jgi:hypothetical protein